MIVKETPVLPARSQIVLIAASTAVVAAAYGLVRLAYGLMLPDVQAELGLDTDTAGLISSGVSIVFCVAALIGLFVASRNARMLVVFAAALLIGIGSGTVWTYGRSLMVDAGANDLVSILAWIALGVGGTVVIVTARWTDRLRPRSAWTVATVVTGAATAALAVLPTVPVLALVAFAVFGWGYCGTLIVWTVQIDPARAPAGTSLLFIVLIFGQGVGVGVAGFIAVSAGYLAAFLVAAAVSFVAGLIVYVKRPEA